MKDNAIKTDRLQILAAHLRKNRQYEVVGNSLLPVLGMHGDGNTIRFFEFPFYECVHLFKEWTFSPEGLPVLEGTSQSTIGDCVADFFNLDDELFRHLFSPYSQDCSKYGGRLLERDATKRDISYNIKCFVEKRQSSFRKIAA